MRLGDHIGDLFVNLVCFLHSIEVRLKEFLKAGMRSLALFDESNLVADTEAILEEERATDALECTLAHDTNAVA